MKEVFEGKTVSVVGNARSLFDSKYGKEIDTAEIVCRIKRGFKATRFSISRKPN